MHQSWGRIIQDALRIFSITIVWETDTHYAPSPIYYPHPPVNILILYKLAKPHPMLKNGISAVSGIPWTELEIFAPQ